MRFEVLTPEYAISNGKHVLSTSESGNVYNGMLAAMDSNGELFLDDGTKKLVGIFRDFSFFAEYPTTANLKTLNAGKHTAYVYGKFTALLSADLFYEGALPPIGTDIYNKGAGGLYEYTSHNTTKVGTCIGTQTVYDATGAATTVGVFQMNIG